MQPYFLAIGELLADLISIDYVDSLEEAKGFQVFQGGSPANLAANLAYLGKEVGLVSCVGNDGIGRLLLRSLQSIGLSSEMIQIAESHPTSLVLVGKSRSTPDFIAYRGADAHITAIDKSLFQKATILHTTAFALSKRPAQQVILEALKKASPLGKKLSVDWNFAPSIWGADDGRAIFEQVVSLKPYLKISVDDMERFFWNGCWYRGL